MATRHDEEVQEARAGQEPEPAAERAPRGVATGSPPTDVPPAEVTDEQALIEEARRRQRRRHRWIAGIVAVALVGAGLGLGLSFGTGAPAIKAHHRAAPSSAAPPSVSSSVALNRPEALAIAPDGDLLIANQGTNQVIRRMPNGALKVVAGNGKAGYAGEGGRALKAELNNPAGMAVSSNGTIYVADTGNNRVRAISPKGIIRTVAGNGRLSFKGLGGPATHVSVPQPVALALGSKGRLYVADDAGIQLISSNGDLSTVLHAGAGVLNINGTRTAFSPSAIAVATNGDLYVADFSPKLLVELTPAGQVVNSWTIYVTPAGLATAPDGSVLVANYGSFAIDRIVNDQITALTTFKLNPPAGLAGAFRPSGVAVTSAGQVYADTDGVNGGTNQPAVAAISATGQTKLLVAGSASH
jgi:hypothetical protein